MCFSGREKIEKKPISSKKWAVYGKKLPLLAVNRLFFTSIHQQTR